MLFINSNLNLRATVLFNLRILVGSISAVEKPPFLTHCLSKWWHRAVCYVLLSCSGNPPTCFFFLVFSFFLFALLGLFSENDLENIFHTNDIQVVNSESPQPFFPLESTFPSKVFLQFVFLLNRNTNNSVAQYFMFRGHGEGCQGIMLIYISYFHVFFFGEIGFFYFCHTIFNITNHLALNLCSFKVARHSVEFHSRSCFFTKAPYIFV